MRAVEDSISKGFQEQMANIIKITDKQGKISGDLTEKWGALDISMRTLRQEFKKEMDSRISALECEIRDNKIDLDEQVRVIDKHKKAQDSKFDKEVKTLGSMVDGAIQSVQDDFEEKYKKIDENINRLGDEDVSAALQNLNNFNSRIKGMFKLIIMKVRKI